MRKKTLAQFDVDPVGGVIERIGSEILQQHIKQAD